jgi:ComF family protein
MKPRCRTCGLAVPEGVQRCGACLLNPPPFARTVVAVDYAHPWTRLIQSLKFNDGCEWAQPLATLLAHSVTTCGATADLLVALPLHEQRLRSRGFNQSWLLAQALGRQLGLPATADALTRWRSTEHQLALDQQARHLNLQGAFMPAPLLGRQVAGMHIALIDDVMTTGATCQAACVAALEGGAASVSLWLLARTPLPKAADSSDNATHVSHRSGSA